MANTETAAPGDEREKLRADRKLQLVEGDDIAVSLEAVHPGVYGFAYAPNSEGSPLYPNRTYQAFEVHKLVDGSVHLAGYMTAEDALKLQTSKEMVELKLYPEPFAQAIQFVSVAQSRITRSKPPSRENGNWLPLVWAGE